MIEEGLLRAQRRHACLRAGSGRSHSSRACGGSAGGFGEEHYYGRRAIVVGVFALLWLSGELFEAWCQLLNIIESVRFWPQQVQAILVVQLLGPTGGRRPIGLQATIIRLWERARRPYVEEWRCRVHRDFNWAAKGRSAEGAVWVRALFDEAAIATGKTAASGMLDLVKGASSP